MSRIPAEFGPVYPALPTVAKFRKAASAGKPTDGYGEAVHAAIRALQKSALNRELPAHKCPCASGTYHNTGKAILKAVAEQNRRRFDAEAHKSTRTDEQLRAAYAEAMKAKRAGVFA